MIRAYVSRRVGTARAMAAVIAAAALVAGCGGSGGGGSTTSTTPANSGGSAATPVVSGTGVGVQDGGSSGSGSSGSGATAGSLSSSSTGHFSNSSTGQLSQSSKTTFSSSQSVAIHSSQNSQVMTPGQVKQAEQKASSVTTTTAPATHTTPAKSSTPPKSTTPSSSAGSPSGSTSQNQTGQTKVVVIHRIKVFTIYRNRTITKTITKTVPPKIPAGAFMPSKQPELAQRVFTIAGANVGCVLAPSGVRCGIEHRNWTAPAQPKTCKSVWGSTIALATNGLPTFACGGANPINTAAKVIPAGWDTTIGDFTCQVRSFGVDCFNGKSNSGFIISRTGYSIY